MFHRSRRPVTAWPVLCLAAGLLFLLSQPAAARPASAQADSARAGTCPGGVGVAITVVAGQEPLDVDPATVTIYLKPGPNQPGRVCWSVGGLAEGETLHIRAKNPANDLLPDRTIVYPKDSANSGVPKAKGDWAYDLFITREGDPERYHFTDPEVIVLDGGDGGTGGGRP